MRVAGEGSGAAVRAGRRLPRVVGRSSAMRQVFELIDRVASTERRC
jgi:DNA-binding NtrC family response regulator